MLLTYSQVLYHLIFFLSTLLLVVYNFFQYEFFCFMSFIKEKSSPLLPFRWEQLYELWLDIINLCLPFNFDYDMIFSESVTEMEICFEEKRIDFYCRDPDSGGGSLAWFSDYGETFP